MKSSLTVFIALLALACSIYAKGDKVGGNDKNRHSSKKLCKNWWAKDVKTQCRLEESELDSLLDDCPEKSTWKEFNKREKRAAKAACKAYKRARSEWKKRAKAWSEEHKHEQQLQLPSLEEGNFLELDLHL